MGLLKPYQGCIALLSSSVALGDAGVTEFDLFDDLSAVSTVSGFEQRIEQAPASVTVIDQKLIKMSGAQTFVDIFRLVPGFQSYYVTGNFYGISYHDIGKQFPNQLEVMVDGRFVFDGIFAAVNWGTLGIEISDIERIEIVRGSNAAAQGSNAFRNSINIITRNPAQDQGLQVLTTLGDISTRNGAIRYGGRAGNLAYRATLGYQENEGFPAVAEGPMEDGRHLVHANARATITPTLLDTVDVAFGYARDKVGWGDADHPDEFNESSGYSHFQSVKWQHSADADNDYKLHLYHSRFKATNLEDLGPAYAGLGLSEGEALYLTGLAEESPQDAVDVVRYVDSQDPDMDLSNLNDDSILGLIDGLFTHLPVGLGVLRSERVDLQFQHDFRHSQQLRGTWGAGYRDEGIERYRQFAYDIEADEQSYRLFAHLEWWPTDRLVLNNGFMVEKTFVGTQFSPRTAANYLINDYHTVRVAFARSNRTPSLLEANERNVGTLNGVIYDALRVSDPDLAEERLDTAEFGYVMNYPDKGLRLDLRVFYEHLRDPVNSQEQFLPVGTQTLDDNIKVIKNGLFWKVRGAELQASYQISADTFMRLHYMNVDLDRHSLTRLDVTYDNLRARIRGQQDRMARHSGGVLLHHQLSPAWSVGVNTYFQSKVRWEEGNKVDGFIRTDLQLGYQFQIGSSEGSVRLIAQNIGADYEEFIDNNHFETRVFLAAEIKLP